MTWTDERRRAQAERMRKRNADPAYWAKVKEGASRSLRERWQTPEFRTTMRDAITSRNRKYRSTLLKRFGLTPDQVDFYRLLRRKRFPEAEALEIARRHV